MIWDLVIWDLVIWDLVIWDLVIWGFEDFRIRGFGRLTVRGVLLSNNLPRASAAGVAETAIAARGVG